MNILRVTVTVTSRTEENVERVWTGWDVLVSFMERRSRGGIGGNGKRRKCKLTNKHLPDAPAQCKTQHIPPHRGMPPQKRQRRRQLPRAARNIHPEPLTQRRVHEPRAQEQITPGNHRRQQIIRRHHLRPGIRLERLEDVVLRAVGQAVKQQIDAEQQHAPRRLPRVRRRCVLLVLAAGVQREDGHAARHGRDDQVLVQRVALAEDGDVQEHDGQQLAALCEDEGDVVDVRERGVAEGRGERVGEGDEEERGQDGARGDQGGSGLPAGRTEDAEELAAGRGEERLDGEEEDGELEALAFRAVGGGRELLLEVGPC